MFKYYCWKSDNQNSNFLVEKQHNSLPGQHINQEWIAPY